MMDELSKRDSGRFAPCKLITRSLAQEHENQISARMEKRLGNAAINVPPFP